MGTLIFGYQSVHECNQPTDSKDHYREKKPFLCKIGIHKIAKNIIQKQVYIDARGFKKARTVKYCSRCGKTLKVLCVKRVSKWKEI